MPLAFNWKPTQITFRALITSWLSYLEDALNERRGETRASQISARGSRRKIWQGKRELGWGLPNPPSKEIIQGIHSVSRVSTKTKASRCNCSGVGEAETLVAEVQNKEKWWGHSEKVGAKCSWKLLIHHSTET